MIAFSLKEKPEVGTGVVRVFLGLFGRRWGHDLEVPQVLDYFPFPLPPPHSPLLL